MTLHSAKGLEFPFVFLVGVENGLLPHKNAETPEEQDEERRLFYVGLTRAEKEVAVTCAQYRYMWGRKEFRQPSIFLQQIPLEDVEQVDSWASSDNW